MTIDYIKRNKQHMKQKPVVSVRHKFRKTLQGQIDISSEVPRIAHVTQKIWVMSVTEHIYLRGQLIKTYYET
jgi:hypothetical protein